MVQLKPGSSRAMNLLLKLEAGILLMTDSNSELFQLSPEEHQLTQNYKILLIMK